MNDTDLTAQHLSLSDAVLCLSVSMTSHSSKDDLVHFIFIMHYVIRLFEMILLELTIVDDTIDQSVTASSVHFRYFHEHAMRLHP